MVSVRRTRYSMLEQQDPFLGRVDAGDQAEHLDPWLEAHQRVLGLVLGQRGGGPVRGANTCCSRPAPKSGRITRSPRAVRRISRIDWRTWSSRLRIAIRPWLSTPSGKATPAPRNSLPSVGSTTMLLPRYPISTVPAATTLPTGRSDGSLQVVAVSPLRAAGLPLISTVGLPSRIVARWPAA